MTKDDIIFLPDPHLRTKSQRVGVITPQVLQIIQDMQDSTINWDESREHEVGVALAAVQIDQLFKIIIVRNNYDNKDDKTFTTFINPEITKFEGDIVTDYEGCLSVRDIYGLVPRYRKVRVKATGIDGKEFRVTAVDFLARIFQHEIDHTNGIVFIDHIKDTDSAFYQLQDDGKLKLLDYEEHIHHDPILWQ
jgi:peptide deformylase